MTLQQTKFLKLLSTGLSYREMAPVVGVSTRMLFKWRRKLSLEPQPRKRGPKL